MVVFVDVVMFCLYYLFFGAVCWRLYSGAGGFKNKTSLILALVWPLSLPALTVVAAYMVAMDYIEEAKHG